MIISPNDEPSEILIPHEEKQLNIAAMKLDLQFKVHLIELHIWNLFTVSHYYIYCDYLCFCDHTHRGLCFFLQSHILTVFWIMMQAPARYRILFFTAGGGREGGGEGGWWRGRPLSCGETVAPSRFPASFMSDSVLQ